MSQAPMSGMTFELNPEMHRLVQQAVNGFDLSPDAVSRFTPSDVRLGIQWLMAEGQVDLAQALADAGIALHPRSEDILAMAGLLAMTRQDWPLAIELLQDLRALQGERTQAMTFRMLARACYCNLDLAEAVEALRAGLQRWPEDAALLEERQAMASLFDAFPASAQSA